MDLEGRSDERRCWVLALVSIADGILLALGVVEFDCAGEEYCRPEGKDWRLLARAIRDYMGQCALAGVCRRYSQRGLERCRIRRQPWNSLTRNLSDRDAASMDSSLGALSSAMFKKRSSPCPPSVPAVSAAPWRLFTACVSPDRLRMPEPYSEEPSAELAMCRWRRGVLAEFWRESVGVFVCVCGASSPEASESLRCRGPLELRGVPPGDTRPSWESCCCAKAKSAGCCDGRRA